MAEEKNDDVISLADLVNDTAQSNVAANTPPPEPVVVTENPGKTADPAGATSAKPQAGTSLEQMESLLNEEDPEFSKQATAIREAAEAADVVIDSIDVQAAITADDALASAKGFKRVRNRLKTIFTNGFAYLRAKLQFVPEFFHDAKKWLIWFFKVGIKLGLTKAKEKVAALFARLGIVLAKFKALPKSAKLKIGLILLFSVLAFMILMKTFKGQIFPEAQHQFLPGFEGVADHVYHFDPTETLQDFNDPLRHPEFVVQLDKMVVNLRRPRSSNANPMGMFEFYIEASSQEAAIEIADRRGEVGDLVQKTVAAMPYEELVTFEGKDKLKVMIRRDLNAFLTKGRVKKVMYKTVVLKP